eukprot:s7122_g3.t1
MPLDAKEKKKKACFLMRDHGSCKHGDRCEYSHEKGLVEAERKKKKEADKAKGGDSSAAASSSEKGKGKGKGKKDKDKGGDKGGGDKRQACKFWLTARGCDNSCPHKHDKGAKKRFLAEEFAAILLSPPCSSFSRATWANFRAAATSTPLVAAKPQADSGLARAAGDPDRDFLGQGEEGLPVGILDPLPRTPHIFEDQLKWHLENAPWEASLAASLGTQLRLGGGTPGHREFFKAKFDEDVEEGLMAKAVTYHLRGAGFPLDMLLYADDLESMGHGAKGRQGIPLSYLFLAALGFPFKWANVVGEVASVATVAADWR